MICTLRKKELSRIYIQDTLPPDLPARSAEREVKFMAAGAGREGGAASPAHAPLLQSHSAAGLRRGPVNASSTPGARCNATVAR